MQQRRDYAELSEMPGKMNREGLTEKMALSQGLKEVRG